LTGPLTGTSAIGGNRFTIVAKSPKTGGWGDANSGGRFGPALKQAGLDALFLTGSSQEPVYVQIESGRVKICSAGALWGLCATETENRFKERFGKKAHAAVIGPSGEKRSLMSCIINDGGRAAGRSGLGAVMGSKRLKGVVAIGAEPVQTAEEEELKIYRRTLIKKYYNKKMQNITSFRPGELPAGLNPMYSREILRLKNWAGSVNDFLKSERSAEKPCLNSRQKHMAAGCVLLCAGPGLDVPEGPYAGKGFRPEYETLAAFGPMCCNDNPESICFDLTPCVMSPELIRSQPEQQLLFAIECF